MLGPALQLQQDYRCRVDFLAYELSFLADGMGLTTKMDGSGGRHPPTANADRRAKMFYATAREYAQLQGIKVTSGRQGYPQFFFQPHVLVHRQPISTPVSYARSVGHQSCSTRGWAIWG